MAEIRDALPGEPVLVDAPRGSKDVRVRPAFAVEPGLYAPIESVGWEPAGTVWKVSRYEQSVGDIRSAWKGVTSGGTSVEALTRKGIIAALLDARGEFEVTINDTIPSLFELMQIDVDDQGNPIWGSV